MPSFLRARALLVALLMLLSGSTVLVLGPGSASAQPSCGIDDVQHAPAATRQVRPSDDGFLLEPDFYSDGIDTLLSVPDPGVFRNDTLPGEYYATIPEGGYPIHGEFDYIDEGFGGGFEYCPDEGFVGTDHFTYEVCDETDDARAAVRPADGDGCQEATVTITVGGDAGGCVSGFPDVPDSNPFCPDVAYLTTYGFAKGYPDGTFHPTADVTRGAAAAVLQRFADIAAPSTCARAPFSDVAVSNPFCASIAYLAARKVIAGYADGTFRPNAVVTRGAVASFLYKLANRGTTPPACTSRPFSDVPVSNAFCGAISWVKSQGIADGNTDGTFHPAQAVSREALARFVHRLGSLGN